MRVQLGDRVRTRDGHDVGPIERLIVNPRQDEVEAVVVRRGFILTDDVEIPLAMMQRSESGDVQLSIAANEIDTLPRFVETSYTAPPSDYRSPYDYPPAGLLWPVAAASPTATFPQDSLPADVAENIEQHDPNILTIQQGSDVLSRDGEKVGVVHSLAVDTASGRVTDFVIRKGVLFAHDRRLPATAIASVDEGGVVLNLDKDELDQATTGPSGD